MCNLVVTEIDLWECNILVNRDSIVLEYVLFKWSLAIVSELVETTLVTIGLHCFNYSVYSVSHSTTYRHKTTRFLGRILRSRWTISVPIRFNTTEVTELKLWQFVSSIFESVSNSRVGKYRVLTFWRKLRTYFILFILIKIHERI